MCILHIPLGRSYLKTKSNNLKSIRPFSAKIGERLCEMKSNNGITGNEDSSIQIKMTKF